MASHTRREQLVDPRVVRSRRVILQAALVELAAAGYGGFTIDSVAKRARVGRSTVYRHWASKADLIAGSLESLNHQPAPDLSGGSPRDQVELLLTHLVAALTESSLAPCVPALIDAAERDAAVREIYHRYNASRRQVLVDTIAAGMDAGAFPATRDPDLAALTLAGAIFYRRLMTDDALGPSLVADLVDTVLGP